MSVEASKAICRDLGNAYRFDGDLSFPGEGKDLVNECRSPCDHLLNGIHGGNKLMIRADSSSRGTNSQE